MREAGQFRFALESDCLAVSVSAFCPYLYARLGDGWVLALAGGDGKSGCGELDVRVVGSEPPTYSRLEQRGAALLLRGEGEGWAVTTQCCYRDGGAGLHFRTRLEVQREIHLERLRSTLWFVPGGKPLSQYSRPDDVWVPHLRPDTVSPIPAQVHGSSALVLEHGGVGAILIPDSGSGPAHRTLRAALDLDLSDPRRDAPRISCGLTPRNAEWKASTDSGARSEIRLAAGTTIDYGYSIWLIAGVASGETRRNAIRRLWRLHGHRRYLRAPTQSRPWSEHAEAVFPSALTSHWRPLTLAGKPAGGFQECEGATVIPFGACRNALQSAYGLYWWGSRRKQRAWREAAELVRNLMLAAPTRSGCFQGGLHGESLKWVGGEALGDCFGATQMAWSAYWMVRWHRELRPDPELLRRASALGEFLVTTQLPSGAIPPYFRMTDLQPSDLSPAGASTATAALLLAELAGAVRRPAFVRAARRGAEFLMSEVIPGKRYFEEPEPLCEASFADPLDPGAHALLHFVLTIHRTAEALRALYEVSREARLLEIGLRALDHLCAYQVAKTSTARFARPFGVFAVDGQVDRRCHLGSGAFAETLLHYYRLTGIREYFERGVAALRASFTDGGNLAALAGTAAVDRRFGSLFIDVPRGFAGGLDGCSVRPVGNSACRIEIEESLGRARSIDVVIEGLPSGIRLQWNRRDLPAKRAGGDLRACLALDAHGHGFLGWRRRVSPAKSVSGRRKRC